MNNTLTAVIVDDEEAPRRALSGLLQRHHPEIGVLGTADDVPSGLELVRRTSPDVLFLDIELKDKTGFDLLRTLGDQRPHVIFTTAHESYALKAIRFSALDYLLKPIDPAELKAAIGKAVQAAASRNGSMTMELLLRNIDRSLSERIVAVPINNGLEMVHLNEIITCESDSNYTTLLLRDNSRLVVSRTLKEFEDLLAGKGFFRVHNSHLINLGHAKKYLKGEGGEVVMTNGTSIPVSRRRKNDLLDALGRL